MNGIAQLVVVGLIIAAAVAFTIGRVLRIVRGKKSSCCSGGDPTKASPGPKGCSGCSSCGTR